MRLIFRNFVSILKCYKQSSLFNILGLSFAFLACYLIFIQSSYDFNFGKVHKDYENIYRSDVKFGDSKLALGTQLVKLELDKSSSVIASTMIQLWGNTGISTEVNGGTIPINTEILKIDTNANIVIGFDMVVGEFKSIANPNSVIIPLSLAKNTFGGAENAIGKYIYCKGTDDTYDVVAVYQDFSDLAILQNHIYTHLDIDYNGAFNGFNWLLCFKVTDGANVVELEKAVSDGMSVLLNKFDMGIGVSIYFTALKDIYFEKDTQHVYHPTGNKSVTLTLILVSILIMAIAIINFVNFSIALAPRRIKSINTYRVLGHSLGGLRCMLIFEAVFISFISFLLSICFIQLISDTTFANVFSSSILVTDNISVLVVMAGFSLVIGVIAGIYPAFHITNFSPALVLNGGKSLPKSALLIRQFLISFQYIISISMIIISIFINLQNNYMMNKDYGYDTENLLEIGISSSKSKIVDALKNNYSFIKDITSSSASLIKGEMYSGWSIDSKNAAGTLFRGFHVAYNYPEFMGLEIFEGEGFTEGDAETNTKYILFNETAKKKYNLVVGQKIDMNNHIIKGFFKDINHQSLHNVIEPFGLTLSKYGGNTLSVKYIGDQNIGNVIDAIRKVVADINDGEIADISTTDQVRYETYKRDANLNTIISWAAMLAILISIIGVVGLISLESQHRIREIALRKVHGATTGEILKMFNVKFVKIVAICYVISVPIAWWIVDKWLQEFEYRVPMSAWVFIVSGVFIASLTVFIITAQSYKAATTNPARAM